MFYDVGYVILVPLAAILFRDLGRHPSAGVCAAFAGITFGNGANIVANSLDSTLISYTKQATTILDATYKVHSNGNLIFMIASTFLIAYIGMLITEKIIIPKLGKYTFDVSKEELLKELEKLPKIETNNPISAMNSINVDDLMSAVDRLNKIPDYNDLLKENQELKKQLQTKHDGFMASTDELCEYAVENDKLKKQNVVTGKLLWGSYYEVKSGLSEEDYIAFPYGKTVVEGADTKESSSSDYYNS